MYIFINRYTQRAHVPNTIRSVHHTQCYQHTVLFNHNQTMNLWGKELQVFHLCEVAMATPQQTLDRTRVFPINAFFCSKMSVRAHCIADGLGGAASESEKQHFRHYSYPHAWYKQGAKCLCRHLEVTRRTGRLHLSLNEDYCRHCSWSHWTFACLQYMSLLTTPHYGARQQRQANNTELLIEASPLWWAWGLTAKWKLSLELNEEIVFLFPADFFLI